MRWANNLNLDEFEHRVIMALGMYAETSALKLENYAKRNAKWTNRTGQARGGLKGAAHETTQGFQIVLAYQAPHGIWLELAMQKNWAIVAPTITLLSPQIMQGLQGLIGKIRL